MFMIDCDSYRAKKSMNRRVRFLIFHYTAMNFSGSIAALTGNAVSAHYLLPNETDHTYLEAGFNGFRIFNLVDENERAWHAGVSYWAGRNNLNDTSIGIETVNEAKEEQGKLIFPPFTEIQIQALEKLSKSILKRYPDITPTQVLGHSDIALGRKSDPGAAFPWEHLYRQGIGAWYEKDRKNAYVQRFEKEGLPNQDAILEKLRVYGYDTKNAKQPKGYQDILRAFQLHFRSQSYSGQLDAETAAILFALVDKYFPGKS